MTKDEPPSPSSSKSSPFLVGRDSHGHWVVQDQSHRRGGLFINRVEALKYAMFENGRRAQAVIMVPDVLELDMTAKPLTGERFSANARASLQRVA
jgi:hypothetical protein